MHWFVRINQLSCSSVITDVALTAGGCAGLTRHTSDLISFLTSKKTKMNRDKNQTNTFQKMYQNRENN